MTPAHCQAIMRNLPIIKAVAEGRPIYFAAFDYRGKFLGWRESKGRLLLGPLEAGFYSVKPRYQCLKPGKPKPVPYPDQQARAAR